MREVASGNGATTSFAGKRALIGALRQKAAGLTILTRCRFGWSKPLRASNYSLVRIQIEDLGALLTLNNAFATELSLLDEDSLSPLIRNAFYARRIGNVDAFAIAFDHQNSDYKSPNYLWFRARYPHFVYVDRVVVTEAARGRGYARHLYTDLMTHALAAGHDRIVCEVNRNPPNPGSDAFHATLGFSEIGAATIHGGLKTVRYLELQLK